MLPKYVHDSLHNIQWVGCIFVLMSRSDFDKYFNKSIEHHKQTDVHAKSNFILKIF